MKWNKFFFDEQQMCQKQTKLIHIAINGDKQQTQ